MRPFQGRIVEREYTTGERAALGAAISVLGEKTLDVYLNDRAFWGGSAVLCGDGEKDWGDFTIGSEQVSSYNAVKIGFCPPMIINYILPEEGTMERARCRCRSVGASGCYCGSNYTTPIIG